MIRAVLISVVPSPSVTIATISQLNLREREIERISGPLREPSVLCVPWLLSHLWLDEVRISYNNCLDVCLARIPSKAVSLAAGCQGGIIVREEGESEGNPA